MRRSVAGVAALLIAAAGCAEQGPAPTLEILAGSELADLADVLEDAADATGVRVDLTYTGSLQGAERIALGTTSDAAWFASDRYLALVGATSKALDRRPIMHSPVVVGVRRTVAAELGWTPPKKVSWADVAAAASNGRFRFAMTNPTASNTGFSAMVGVATALNGGRALETDAIDVSGLKGFFSGQALTSASSGLLAETYEDDQGDLDGIINYESVLIELNETDDLDEPLELVYPDEGIVTADYPLVLLDRSKREAYEDLAAYLRRPDVQRRITDETARRPAVRGVPLGDRFGERLLVEASFPANVEIVRRLLDEFSTEVRKPTHIFYVLDTSESMESGDVRGLRSVFTGLAGLDRTHRMPFTRPPPRERVTVIVATTGGPGTREVDIDWSGDPSAGRAALRRHVDMLEAKGRTVLYTALLNAYELAGQAQRNEGGVVVSVVVMTDGHSTSGTTYRQFVRLLDKQAPEVQAIPAYSLLFGDPIESPFGDPIPDELEDLAERTGGKVFDARDADLSVVAKEIRGYE